MSCTTRASFDTTLTSSFLPFSSPLLAQPPSSTSSFPSPRFLPSFPPTLFSHLSLLINCAVPSRSSKPPSVPTRKSSSPSVTTASSSARSRRLTGIRTWCVFLPLVFFLLPRSCVGRRLIVRVDSAHRFSRTSRRCGPSCFRSPSSPFRYPVLTLILLPFRRTEAPKGKGKKPVNKDRFVSKMCTFARSPSAAAYLVIETNLSLSSSPAHEQSCEETLSCLVRPSPYFTFTTRARTYALLPPLAVLRNT